MSVYLFITYSFVVGKELYSIICELIPKLKSRQSGGNKSGSADPSAGGGGASGGGAQASSKKKKGKRK